VREGRSISVGKKKNQGGTIMSMCVCTCACIYVEGDEMWFVDKLTDKINQGR